jgi:light-regulated signal transduction histidine kinase (bacteriophytochrome)
MFIDITERLRAEAQIRHLNEQLKARAQALAEANNELESFSFSVSHDLRAPLRVISGYSHILLEDCCDKLGAEDKDGLQAVVAASQRMGELIDDLLQLSGITRSELHRAPVDLSALARSVADELRKANPERSVELLIEPDLITQADARLMRIVLENLLGNAWKFTSQKPVARIEFGRTTRKGAPAYFVRDNGAGFDMAYANKLFGAFQRLHSTTEFPGTGIGLATVQRVIHRHGGQVWAEGEVGRGATFYFRLPNELKAQ